MKSIVIIMIRLVLITGYCCMTLHAAAAAHYEKLKIFDRGEFKNETYYSEMFSTNTVKTDFVGEGSPLTSSSLTSSTARIIDCPESVNRKIRENISKAIKKNNELSFDDLSVKECILIDYKGVKAYFAEFEYRVSLVNASYAAEKGIPIIWVGMEDKNGLKDICFLYSYLFPRGDDYLRADLAGVADVDRDGRHEIVIDVHRYAGRGYKVIGLENGKLVQKELNGDSWD